MTSYRYIGYGTTNSNGVAHLDHDPQGNPINGYTGTGAGKIDVLASTDNPITEGSIVSETYSVIDCLFYDKALDGTGQHNDDWQNVQNRLKITRGSDGTTLESLGEQWAQWYVKNINSSFDVPFAVEFKVLDYADTPAIRFNDGTKTTPQNVTDGDWKIEFFNDDIKVYKNNQQVQSTLGVLIGATSLKVFWELSHPTDMVKFSDFVIYPI